MLTCQLDTLLRYGRVPIGENSLSQRCAGAPIPVPPLVSLWSLCVSLWRKWSATMRGAEMRNCRDVPRLPAL